MSASNKGPGIDSRLQNLTNALYVDSSNDIVMRTGFAGNIVISGNVNVPGDVTVNSSPANPNHVHLSEVGTSGILTVPWLPVSGNVRLDSGTNSIGNVRITDGSITVTNFPAFPSNVSITSLPGIAVTNFPSNVSITALPSITGNVGVSGNVDVTRMPAVTGNVHVYGNVSVDNFPSNVSITQMPGITGNVNIVSVPPVLYNSDYYLNIARGLVAGQYQEFKNGYATGISQNTEITIWNEVVLYPWDSWTVASRLYIKSSSASDTGQTLRIEGLDSSYNKITEDVTTNGVTAVATTQNFLRLNRASIINGPENVGTITQRITSGTGTVVGSMAIGFARNKGGFFTVPNGYTAYMLYGDATQFRGGSGNIGGVIKMFTRTNGNGSHFMCQVVAEVVNGLYRNDFKIPLEIPAKTDIDVRLVADGNNTQATCSWQMILIAN
jgi:cytoskeletal protein CcmA (bactofilin family)